MLITKVLRANCIQAHPRRYIGRPTHWNGRGHGATQGRQEAVPCGPGVWTGQSRQLGPPAAGTPSLRLDAHQRCGGPQRSWLRIQRHQIGKVDSQDYPCGRPLQHGQHIIFDCPPHRGDGEVLLPGRTQWEELHRRLVMWVG